YTSNDFLYIAMEFIENGDLSALINSYRTSPFPEEICREITRQVLEGVKVLHERHICHRDLKPQNILVARIYPIHVKIADFGSSKYLEGTQFRTRVGTPGYIAPELLGAWEQSDRGNMLGYSVDMWAVGCITHELLLSKRPLTDMLSLIHFCNGDSSHLVESLRISGITAEAGEVVEGLLRANPSLRLSASQALNLPWMSGAGRARHARSTATRNFQNQL
ncbi:kinase-like domain-containing protein, partial [Morchella snyderi]